MAEKGVGMRARGDLGHSEDARGAGFDVVAEQEGREGSSARCTGDVEGGELSVRTSQCDEMEARTLVISSRPSLEQKFEISPCHHRSGQIQSRDSSEFQRLG